MLKKWQITDQINCSCYSNETGSNGYFITITTGEQPDFNSALERLTSHYKKAQESCGIGLETLIFSRLYFSDICNQIHEFNNSKLCEDLKNGAHSRLEQWPIGGHYLSLFIYHVKPAEGTLKKDLFYGANPEFQNNVVTRGRNYSMMYTSDYTHVKMDSTGKQTTTLFTSLKSALEKNNMNMLENTARTWVFVRDVDFNYQAMVEARKEFFEDQGLNANTRFPASTGIEGKMHRAEDRVALESLSFGPLEPGQITTMEAPENLSNTLKYGVTFARGTKVQFGDRNHFYISGTASIDKNGEIMYTGDVVKQTRRTLDNIRALLKGQGADLNDMAYFLIYIRDPHNYTEVMEVFKEYLPDPAPFLVIRAAVCRPGWLVEIEGMALTDTEAPYPVFL